MTLRVVKDHTAVRTVRYEVDVPSDVLSSVFKIRSCRTMINRSLLLRLLLIVRCVSGTDVVAGRQVASNGLLSNRVQKSERLNFEYLSIDITAIGGR